MNRRDLQALSKLRRNEAAVLLKAKHYAGAYYLLGYSVECALKACVAKQIRRHDFPDKDLATRAYVHNLEQLLKLAGLGPALNAEMEVNKTLEVNWAVVKDWKEAARYASSISPAEAKDLYSACTSRKNGVLAWIRARW
jgi:hypothetical protein